MSEDAFPAAAAAELRLPYAACEALCEELPRAADLDAAMRIVEGVRRDLLGDGLLTVNLVLLPDPVLGEERLTLQRAWSSNPHAYPVAGRKLKSMTPWTRQLLLQAQVFVGEGDADLAQAFDDHRLIASLGWRAVVNVPVLGAGQRCIATFNALGPRARWRSGEVLTLRLLAALAGPAIARAAEVAVPSHLAEGAPGLPACAPFAGR
jgi:GAF domain-containing protein